MRGSGDDRRRRYAIARRRAAELNGRKQTLLDASAGSRPALAPAAAVGLIAVGLWLFVGKWALAYPIGVHGQDYLLETGFAVVVTVAGFMLRFGWARHRRVASAVTMVVGLLLALAGAFLPHATLRAGVNEVVSGLVVVLLAVLTLGERRSW
ncbi:MAG: hypothetical protein ACR2FG_14525 [Marmoricola sp.]